MPNHNILKTGVRLLTGLCVCIPQMLWVPDSEAMTFNIGNGARSHISIRVGAGGNKVSIVEFTVPVTALGNGSPITSSQPIEIQLVIRGRAGSPVTGILSADSFSNPLTNSSGNTLPFSDISWVASNDDIPSGTFNESTKQILATFQSQDRIIEYHTFSYANTRSAAAGSYNGTIVYTWAAP